MKIVLILIIVLFSYNAKSHELNIGKLAGSKLFFKHQERNIDYQLQTGEMKFRDESDEFSEGYYTASSMNVEGEMTREIFDFNKDYSSFQINKEITDKLKSNGYSILFSCSKDECGELIGWNNLVSSYLVGTDSSQRVLAAKKIFNNLDIGYIFYHLSDIEGEPRLLIDYIETLPLDTKQKNKSLPLSFNFKTNSADIKDVNEYTLSKVANMIKENSEIQYTVIGHTDATGTKEQNSFLSIKRADVIKSYLVDNYGVSADLISTNGLGKSLPKATNQTLSGREINRRVEITRL